MEPTGAIEQQTGAGDTILLALETLERRVQQLLDQLRTARAARTSVDDEVEALREKLAERDRKIDGLTAQLRDGEKLRDDVRRRVEALLGRVGEMEAGA
ncbi:MAG: hypothetical protein OXN89_26565 [Bryobacterales bacterium]|nr:hypothetical protein [Bryobacterales bacterium]